MGVLQRRRLCEDNELLKVGACVEQQLLRRNPNVDEVVNGLLKATPHTLNGKEFSDVGAVVGKLQSRHQLTTEDLKTLGRAAQKLLKPAKAPTPFEQIAQVFTHW